MRPSERFHRTRQKTTKTINRQTDTQRNSSVHATAKSTSV